MHKEITVHPILALQDNYIWAIIDTATQQVVVVDPGESEPVQAFLKEQKLSLQGILITHHHWDHTHGVNALVKEFKVPVFGSNHSSIQDLTYGLKDEERIPAQACPLHLQALSIPGHTLDHLAYYAPGYLFCGDTLFSSGCGRLFEGTASQMHTSLQRLAALPEDTQVYCGHEYTLKNLCFAELVEPSNAVIQERILRVKELRSKNLPTLPSLIEIEKKTNPFLRCEMPEVVAQVEKFAGKRLHKTLEVFTWLRKWKDEFKV